MKLTPFPRVSGRGGGGEGECLASTSFITMPSSDQVKGRLRLSMARLAQTSKCAERIRETFLGLVFWAAGRKGTDYANRRERERERERERQRERERERERERDVMYRMTPGKA